jgi:hypothetical protein
VQALLIVADATRIEFSLRRRGLPATVSTFGLRFGQLEPTDDATRVALPTWATRRARIALLVMRFWPFGDTCLRKSLVIGSRLRALSPQLFIGVRAAGGAGDISAHAWLRITGIDIDPTNTDYVALDLA